MGRLAQGMSRVVTGQSQADTGAGFGDEDLATPEESGDAKKDLQTREGQKASAPLTQVAQYVNR